MICFSHFSINFDTDLYTQGANSITSCTIEVLPNPMESAYFNATEMSLIRKITQHCWRCKFTDYF